MKHHRELLICLLCSLGISAFAAPSRADSELDSPVGDKWALVIGISEFKNSSISQLKYAAKDAGDFADYLVKEAHFAPDHVKVLRNDQATQKHIMSELGSKWLPRAAAPNDMVVIFISSHGSPADMDVQGVNYIITNDSDPEDLYTTAIEMQDLVSTISRRVHSKRLVVFLDTCHSGAANAGAKGIKRTTNIDLEKVPLGNGQIVISSSQSDQVSWELKDRPNGAFTHCLLDVLRHQEDSTIPQVFQNLQDSVQQTVLRERGALQTPVLKSNWKGKQVSLKVMPVNPHPGLTEDSTEIALVPSNPANPGTPVTVVSVPSTGPATNSVTSPPAVIERPPVGQGHVEKSGLPDSIAILPFPAVSKVNIQAPPPNVKVLWGQLKSPQELVGLPNKFAEGIFRGMREKFGSHVLGPQSVNAGLAEAHLNALNTTRWSERDWQQAAEALQSKYLVSATIDEVDWATSMMANKYTMVVSARLVSGDTGRVISEVNSLRIKKAPFQGDAGGARQYLENTVGPSAAKDIAGTFTTALHKAGVTRD